MARYIDTKKNLMEIENPVKNVDIGKAIDTSKNLTSLKTTSFGVLSNKSLEQLNSLLAFTPVISFNEDTAMVTIVCETVGSSIYYTLDGSTPSVSKTKYSAPFSVDKSCTVKAIGVKSGLNNSAVSILEVKYQGGGEVNPPITEEIDMIKKTFGITYNETGIISITGYSSSSVDFSKFICGKFIFDDIIYTSINRVDFSTGFPAFISLVAVDGSSTYAKNDVFVTVLFASDTGGVMTIQNNENETVTSDVWSKINKIDVYLES